MKEFIKKNGTFVALFSIAILLGFLTNGDFFSSRNLTNLVRQVSINGILACGMTVIILTGGIDLSIGSVLGFTGVIVGASQYIWGWGNMGLAGAIMSFGVGILAGTVLGFVNGGLISILKIAPFVITLGMMVIARGLALIISGGSGISPMGEVFVNAGQGYLDPIFTALALLLIAGIVLWMARRNLKSAVFSIAGLALLFYSFWEYKGFPRLALFLSVVLFVVYIILERTPFGRGIYAIGSNEQASIWAGVRVTKIKWIAYSMMGALAGLAGALVTSRQNGATPTTGELAELDAIAAVVIGGTSLKGGTGSVVGSLIGAFIMGSVNNGMDLLGVPSFYQMVLKGLIIIVAVSLDKQQREI